MPTTIDSLVVELLLEAKQFQKSQAQAIESFKKTAEEAKRRGKEVEEAGKKAAQFLGMVKDAAHGLFAIMAGSSMIQFATQTAATVAATGRLAHNIGATTAEAAAFGRMIARNGGDADAAAASLQGLTDQVKHLDVFGEASQQLQMFLGTIGAIEPGITALDAYKKFAEWADAHRNDPALIRTIGLAGGLDPGAINTAMKGAAAVRKEFAEAMKTAPTDSKAMEALQNSIVAARQTLDDLGRDLVELSAGPVTSTLDQFVSWAQANRRVADSILAISTAIVGLKLLSGPAAAWALRMLGFGGIATAAGVGAGALAVGGGLVALGASVLPTSTGAEQDIYDRNGNPTPYGRSLMGGQRSGLPVKPGAGNMSIATALLADQLMSVVPGAIARFTAFDDEFHKARGGKHPAGLALDFALSDPGKSAAVAAAIRAKLAAMGVGADVLDEYANPSPGSTGGHLHVAFANSMAAQRYQDMVRGAQGAGNGHVSTTDVNIGTVVVNTRATDASGIAREIKSSLQDVLGGSSSLAVQANTGLN